MKKFVAIGHWEDSNNVVSVAMSNNTKKDFTADLIGNGFRAYAVLTEKTFREMQNMDCFDLYDKVQKLTTNYRKWNTIADYIEQCSDIIEEKLAKAE